VQINENILAQMCSLAYREPAELSDTVFERFEGFQGFQRSGAEAVVAHDNQTVVVVVRGTQRNLLDLMYDLQFLCPVKQATGFVHRGFRRFADRLGDTGLWDHITGLQPRTLWFAGHSLGGAAASILAGDAIERGFTCPINVFSIGQPRTGTRRWASRLEWLLVMSGGRIDRYVHPLDVVPHLPPYGKRFLPEYRHFGDTRMIRSDGTMLLNATIQESVLLTAMAAFKSPHGVCRAHNTALYVKDFQTWARHRKRNSLSMHIEHETR